MYSARGQQIKSFKPGNQMECDHRNLPEAPGTHQIKFSEKNKPTKTGMTETYMYKQQQQPEYRIISGDVGGDDVRMYDCQEIKHALQHDTTGSTIQNNQMYMMQNNSPNMNMVSISQQY